jgi:glycoprotein endo-alpha-1,2-mannosidase
VLVLVPAAPTARAAPLTVGAYYYAWYGSGGSHWNLGYVRSQLDTPQRPVLGEYDSRDPAVIAQHYAWAHRFGVDVFFCPWRGPVSYDDLTIREGLLRSPARGPTRIALLYESLERLGIGPDDRIHLDGANVATLLADVDYIARTYFRDPAYYRVDGRPVLVLYASRIFRGPVAATIAALRERARAAGVELYLVGDEVDWDLPPDRERIGLFDAVTGYTLYSPTQPAGWPSTTRFVQSVGTRVRDFRRVAAEEGVAFVPGALPGFNDRGVRPEADHYVLPHSVDDASSPDSLFAQSLELAGSLVDPSLRLLTVTSWNEWHEDTQIEPTAPAPPSSGPASATEGYPTSSSGLALLRRLALFERSWAEAFRSPLRGPVRPV